MLLQYTTTTPEQAVWQADFERLVADFIRRGVCEDTAIEWAKAEAVAGSYLQHGSQPHE